MYIAQGRYDGRSALITGGAQGLGYAAAERLAAEGAVVGLIDLNADAVGTAVDRLTDQGYQAFGYDADVTDEARIQTVTADFNDQAGSVDVVVTSAGIFPWVDFEDMNQETWSKVVDVNLGGTFNATHAAMPYMKKQKYGRIVTVSSGTFLIGNPGQSAYIASKGGVIGLTRVLAREGGGFGVTANSILPGLIATEQVLAMSVDVDGFFDQVIAGQSLQRRGEPSDIADAIAYLGSEGSEFVTGQSLSVGGGDRFL